MALTRIDSYLLDLDAIGGIDFDVQNGTPTLKVDETTHRVGIGTASPVTKLDVRGDSYFSGNMGLGTDNPTEKLHVIGQVGGSNPALGSKWDIARFVAHDYVPTNSGGLTIGAYWNNTDVSGRKAYIQSSQDLDSGSTARDLLLNPDGGSVGIGTDDPDGALNVYSTNPTRVVIEGDGQSTAAAALVIKSNDADSNYRATGVFYYDTTSETEWFSGRPYTGSDTFAIHRKTSLGGSTGNTTAHPDNSLFVINSSGNVGVGNTTPAAKLEVSGDAIFTQTSASTQNDCLQIGFTAPNGFIKSKNSSGSPASNLDFYSTDTSGNTNLGIRLQYTGNVGIGTDAPDTRLHIEAPWTVAASTNDIFTVARAGDAVKFVVGYDAAETDMYLGTNTNHTLQIRTNDSPRVTITNTGDVGIGLTNPQQKLTVRGLNEQILLDLNSSTTGDYSSIAWNGTQGDLGTGSYTAEIRGYRSAAGALGDLTFHTRDGFGTSNEIVRITSSGNVGIGTNDPSQKLNVVGNIMLEGSDQYMYLTNVGTGNAGIYVRGRDATNELRSHSTGIFTWEVTGQEKLRLTSDGDIITPNGSAIYVSQSSFASITPSNNDWINIARVPYGAQISGQVMIAWNGIYSPACCHHGHMTFELGSSHGPTYGYQWAASLELTEAQAHNDYWFKEARLVTVTTEGSNWLYLQVKSFGTVTAGSFKASLLRSRYSPNATGNIQVLTPVVDNSQSGTILRHLYLTYDGSQTRVTTPHAYKIQNALGGNTYNEGNLGVGGYLQTPYQPAFFCTKSAGTPSTGNITQWDTPFVNVGSHFDTSTGRFTAPVAGVYHFHFHGFIDATVTTPTNVQVDIRKNAVSLARQYTNRDSGWAGSYGPPMSITATVLAAVNDYFDVYFSHGMHANSGYYFGGYLIG